MFKKTVKEKITRSAFGYLLDKKEKHRKMNELKYYDLKLQPYLKSNEIFRENAQKLFNFRTRMANVKANFPNSKDDTRCPKCGIEDDTQPHLLNCREIIKILPELLNTDAKYSDIFSRNPLKNKKVN